MLTIAGGIILAFLVLVFVPILFRSIPSLGTIGAGILAVLILAWVLT